jgi:hypothetical protein
MIRKSGNRFSEKIMLNPKAKAKSGFCLERFRSPPRDKPPGCGLPHSSLCRASATSLEPMAPKIRIFNSHWHLPKSKPLRIGLGILLIAGGLVGFLPVLGFWMIPLGLLVLSVDLPIVRRWRRQLTVWWHRKKGETGGTETGADGKSSAAP